MNYMVNSADGEFWYLMDGLNSLERFALKYDLDLDSMIADLLDLNNTGYRQFEFDRDDGTWSITMI